MTLRILWTTLEMKYFTAIRNAVCKSHWNSIVCWPCQMSFLQNLSEETPGNIVPWCSQCPVHLWRLEKRWSGSVSYPLCDSLFPKQKLLGGMENDCCTQYNVSCFYNYPNKPKDMVKECRSNVRMRERNDGKRKVNKKQLYVFQEESTQLIPFCTA